MPACRTVSASLSPLLALVVAGGCQPTQQGPERLATIPVRGTVLVDGVPAPSLTVKLHSLETAEGESEIYAAKPSAMTDGDGTFVLSTYEHGDGIAAGTYAVTFEWLNFNFIQNSYGGPDKLKGKYADPEKSEFKVTVTGDEGEEGLVLEPFELER